MILPNIAGVTREWLFGAPLSEVFTHLTGRTESKKYGDEHAFLCPFHPDTVPSLFVNDKKGIGHCFGCDIGFNRYQLLKEFGIRLHNHKDGHKSFGKFVNSLPKVQRGINALKALGRLGEAQKLETCATKFEARKCQHCGETFVISYHCDHRLCPTCNQRHVFRFFERHKETLNFRLEIWGITLALSGRPLSNNGKSPFTNLKALLEEARRALAELRRKYQAFNLFQHAIVVRQLKIKKGIAHLKVHLLMDTVQKEVEILRSYWANKYHWSPVRTVREFQSLSEALGWLMPKASMPLEEYDTPEDLEIWLEATKHIPLIYGLGNFRKIKGDRGKSKPEKESKEPVACPFCGSRDTVLINIVSKEEAWRWDKRFPPPDTSWEVLNGKR